MGTTHAKGRGSKGNCKKIIVPFEVEKITEKWCPQCRKWKPKNLTAFYSNAGQPDRLGAQCKECDNVTNATNKRKKRANTKGHGEAVNASGFDPDIRGSSPLAPASLIGNMLPNSD